MFSTPSSSTQKSRTYEAHRPSRGQSCSRRGEEVKGHCSRSLSRLRPGEFLAAELWRLGCGGGSAAGLPPTGITAGDGTCAAWTERSEAIDRSLLIVFPFGLGVHARGCDREDFVLLYIAREV